MTSAAFSHLLSLSDAIGTFEHAEHDRPRREHGYCTDDMARVLIATCREPDPSRPVRDLTHTALRFLSHAQGADGTVRNRRDAGGRWRGRRSTDDCWGRSIWALGTAAARAPEQWMRHDALTLFGFGLQQRSRSPRAMAFAALGAGEVLDAGHLHAGALDLLADAHDAIGVPSDDADWRWPESRLTYANAALAEALMVVGVHLDRPTALSDALAMTGWLLERESLDGHLSPTPAGGAGRDDRPPRFDQQPIEVAAMADACHRADHITGDRRWGDGVTLAGAWFDGENDLGTPMWDPTTGGGYDGLTPTGPNLNQGAESTLALLTTRQHQRVLVVA
ncbi:MAG: glycosyltransferase [Acidimicrobiales bacterium]